MPRRPFSWTTWQIPERLRDIMAKIDDLAQKVTDLQAALDGEQVQIQAALDAQAAIITDLEAQLGGRATDAQLQDIIDRLETARTDLAGTIADAPPAEPEP